MGYMLKEALKCLCEGAGRSDTHWDYAVFWKIGCQNPKLLIWEEFYYEPIPGMVQGISEIDNAENFNPHLGVLAGNGIYYLISKMMMNCQVNVVGEGIVGRAAFTGMHNWIIAADYIKNAHPPEVLNELQHQYSAGVQTVAVVPVSPHGVVQFGSSSAILEDLDFVNDVKGLILQLGCVPGALLSENYTLSDSPPRIGVPISPGVPVSDAFESGRVSKDLATVTSNSSPSLTSQAASLLSDPSGHMKSERMPVSQPIASSFQSLNHPQSTVNSNDSRSHSEFITSTMQDHHFRNHLGSSTSGAIVIPSNLAVWRNQLASSQNVDSSFVRDTTLSNPFLVCQSRTKGSVSCNSDNNSVSNPLLADCGINSDMMNHVDLNSFQRSFSLPQRSSDANVPSVDSSGFGLLGAESSGKNVVAAGSTDHVITSGLFSGEIDNALHCKASIDTPATATSRKRESDDLFQALDVPLDPQHLDIEMPVFENPMNLSDCLKDAGVSQRSLSQNTAYDSICQPSLGDGLFDIFGADFRSKLLYSSNSNDIKGSFGGQRIVDMGASSSKNLQNEGSFPCSAGEGICTSGIFSESGPDHLLDAVISKANLSVRQSSDDNTSCRTTLTKMSNCSFSDTYPSINLYKQMQGELLGLSESIGKSVLAGSSSYKSGCSKSDIGARSQSSFGSQMNSWVEQGHSVNRESSLSTAFSKRPNEVGKGNRKRLKPGENPRPRPKDRQMIQDRVKELREIVPNAAKCSIDALLERTIKHMLFLQSVTDHADKLKLTGDSKLVSKDGRLCLKDNFGGGVTWAFEVGSQSTVCPIIVEDLNPPRQMLVEMLCEEQGFFLEIADMIRGLELTILKGVMENRDDKIWARFSVEANRDVTRMEIFISLVRLLEQTIKGKSASTDVLDNNNIMAVHHSKHQTTCIPSTDRPCNGILQ